MSRERVAILDFGSQYGQLIARRVREHNVYSVICRADTPAAELAKSDPKGLILSGGPASVYDDKAIKCDPAIFEMGIPILGICYGMQLGCEILGAEIIPAKKREYGRTKLHIIDKTDLFANLPDSITAWVMASIGLWAPFSGTQVKCRQPAVQKASKTIAKNTVFMTSRFPSPSDSNEGLQWEDILRNLSVCCCLIRLIGFRIGVTALYGASGTLSCFIL